MRSLNAFSTRFLLQLIAKKKVRLERATFIHVVQLRFLNETKETRVYSLQEYYLEQGTQCQVLYLQFIVVDLSQLAGFAGNTIVIPSSVQVKFGTKAEQSAWWNDDPGLQIDPSLQVAHCEFIEQLATKYNEILKLD